MSNETNKAIVRRYLDLVIGQGQTDLIEEFLAEGVELHGTPLAPGLAPVEEWVETLKRAFPDRQLTIDDVFAEGDRVVARTTMSGTHLGEIDGIPATGKPVSQPAITIFRLVNGKIAEGWLAADNLSMMQQMGIIPAAQAA